LLGVLGEMEVQIRRGGSMRLAVELLLLRWGEIEIGKRASWERSWLP